MSALDAAIGYVRALFWNDDQHRPRALWRLSVLAVLSVVLSVAVTVALTVVSATVQASVWFGATPPQRLLRTSLTAAATIVSVYVVGRFLDRRPFADFGLDVDRDWLVDLGFGLALGAGLMTCVFALELALGWVRVVGTLRGGGSLGFLPAATAVLGTFLLVGFYEELLARGYLLTNVAEGLARFGRAVALGVATLVSSGVFGLLHAGNPNATALSTLTIGLAGVFLALGYLLTGELAIPVGLHVTWNFFQGVVYGFPVSGLALGVSVVAVEQRGPAFLTGGSFGPEAGLVGVAAMFLGSLAIVGWVRLRYGAASLAPVETPQLR